MEAKTTDRNQTSEITHSAITTRNNEKSQSKCFDKNTIFIYSSHFLSSFGDRTWHFAVGLFLYYLYPCSLLLTAIHGLTTCGSLFLLGAPVGRWVDKSKRLKAARVTILVQNAAVVINAAIMAFAIAYKDEAKKLWHGYFEFFVYATIIIVEITSELASMANKLVLEKDWIVVLANGDENKLSSLNATMRTINLSCKLLAPFFVGHLIELTSYMIGAIFIASWNVISAVVEYYLLYLIFSLVPELSRKKGNKLVNHFPSDNNKPEEEITTQPKNSGDKSVIEGTEQQAESISKETNNNGHNVTMDKEKINSLEATLEADNRCVCQRDQVRGNGIQHQGSVGDAANNDHCQRKCSIWSSFDGWKVYFSHSVKFAGLALASLYMTVLSFDNVTIGYLSSQGVGSALSGNLTAVSALIGILGSLSSPFIRKRLGKNKTGMFGFGMETICLFLCVISIIAPGSPFKPASLKKILDVGTASCHNKTRTEGLSVKEQWEQHSNIFLLMAGIVTARYGLWIADLSVTQIFQENVEESHRGVMGGVQSSINQLMSLIKFALTIVLPYPDTFGFLICLSWLFVFFGWTLFTVFVFKTRKPAIRRESRCQCQRMQNEEPSREE